MKKRVLYCLSAALLGTAMSFTACGKAVSTGEEIDETKSLLKITTRGSGLGSDWLAEIGEAFEEKYANVSFEEGKKGVEVVSQPDTTISGATLVSNFSRLDYDVIISDDIDVAALVQASNVKDITDAVKGTMDFTVTDVDGNEITMGETSTLESKLFDEQKEFLAETGKYYVLPWTFSYANITYNATLWEEKGYYFAEDKTNAYYLDNKISSYTGQTYTGRGFIIDKTDTKSVGPDGKPNTYDDGMPSSYEEYMYLFDYITDTGVAPLTFSGVQTDQYTSKYYEAFATSYYDKEDLKVLFTQETKNGNTVEIVTGFNGDTPIVAETAVTEDTGYLVSQLAGKYYALDMINKSMAKEKYLSPRYRASSHIDTQDYFIRSTIVEGETPTAMLLDGSYWFYEARSLRSAVEHNYGAIDDFKTLPIPRQLTGTVEAGRGTDLALISDLKTFTVVNPSVSGVREKLAKMFVRFAYTDEMLQTYTEIAQMPVEVKYNMDAVYDDLTVYGKDQIDIYEALIETDSIAFAYSTSKAYKNNPVAFELLHHRELWKSANRSNAWQEFFYGNSTVKQYFEGSWINKETWDSKYLKK